MKRKALPLLAIALVASFSVTAGRAEQATIGNTKVIVKTVTGTSEGTVRTLDLQDDVYHNEKIETKEESATQLVFLDDTTVTLGPNSELVLDRFVYDPDQSKSAFVMTVTKGAFRFASGKLPGKAYKIHTPAATLGVRGTEFDVVVSRAATGADEVDVEVSVIDGEVLVGDCSGANIRLSPSTPPAHITYAPGTGCQIR